MSLILGPAPHSVQGADTGRLMRQVVYATLPGLTVLTWIFGWGTLINVIWAVVVAVAVEAAVLQMRGRDVRFFLGDGSAVVTGVLLGLSLPPTAPWWLTLVGVAFAVIVAKHLYGGLGMNPFNPAMVGYALLLVSFPVAMTSWIAPFDPPTLDDSVALFLGRTSPDTFTGATPLDTFRTGAGDARAIAGPEILQGRMAGRGWEWVNAAFLLGGFYLLGRRIINWHIPAGFLAGLALPALTFWLINDVRYADPLFHLFSGGTMLGAFFIATDPVSAATSNQGRLIYGLLIGVLIWVIRTFGGYPDAVAFAVLLMNLAAPTLDYYTRPRTYGHDQPDRGIG
jgi:electron transport complex protein RnfD